MSLKSMVLVLNQSYEPTGTISREDAFINYFNGKVYIEEYTDEVYHSAKAEWKVPSVIRLKEYKPIEKNKRASLSKRNRIYMRDKFRCFHPDTKILMSDGSLKLIKDILVGDRVIDAYGNEQEVLHVIKNHFVGDLIKIRQRGNGEYLLATPEHKMLVLNMIEKNAKELTLLDKLPKMNLSNFEFPSEYKFDLSNIKLERKIHIFDDKVKYYSGKLTNRYLNFDIKLGKLIGYFLAEGSIQRNNIAFCFHINETEYHNEVRLLIKEVFGLDSNIYYDIKHNTAVIILGSKIIARFIQSLCYTNGKKSFSNKKYPKEFFIGLMHGVLNGDGHIDLKLRKATIKLAVKQLVEDLYIISNMIGLEPTLSKDYISQNKYTKSIIFQSEVFGKLCSLLNIDGFIETNTIKKSDSIKINDISFSKVAELSNHYYDGYVYDLTISGSHTYVANFIGVHNCGYCGNKGNSKDLTLDHIIPRAKNGDNDPQNLVTCCFPCNQKKKDKFLEEIGMKLLYPPKHLQIGLDKVISHYYAEVRPSWAKYLFLSHEGDKTYTENTVKI